MKKAPRANMTLNFSANKSTETRFEIPTEVNHKNSKTRSKQREMLRFTIAAAHSTTAVNSGGIASCCFLAFEILGVVANFSSALVLAAALHFKVIIRTLRKRCVTRQRSHVPECQKECPP